MTEKPKDYSSIISRIDEAEKWRDSNFRDRWKKFYQMYRSIPGQRDAGQSNIFVPYVFMIVEVVKARLAESLFAARPYLSVLPRNDEDKEKAEKTGTLLDWQLNERMEIATLFREQLLQSLCCFGTAVSYTGWLKKTRKIKKNAVIRVPLTDQYGQPMITADGQIATIEQNTVIDKEITVYDDPICQIVDIFDFFVDPNANDIEDARFCGHREYQSKEQLENMVKNGKYKIDWKKVDESTNVEDGRKQRLDVAGVTLSTEMEADTGKNNNGLYLVHHYWEDNRHIVFINQTYCALDEENPFWHGMKPYHKDCYTPLPNEFYGIGIPESIEYLQLELNTTRNQRIDYNSMALRRMWKLRKGCGLTPKDMIWRQNGVLAVENMDDIQEIQVADIPATAFANESVIKQDMRDATGCHDIIMGLSEADETATTTMTKDNNASVRFKDVVSSICSNLIVKIGEMCVSLDQQFLTEDRRVRLMNDAADQVFTISPYEIDGEYDLIYVGSAVEPMANKELIKQHAIEAYNIVAGNPLYEGQPEPQIKVLESVFKSLEMENISELLPQATPPPPPPDPTKINQNQTPPLPGVGF